MAFEGISTLARAGGHQIIFLTTSKPGF